MLRYSACFTMGISVLIGACSRTPADPAKPVASASVSVTPAVVASGMPVELDVRFAVSPDAPPFKEDYAVFIHVVDGDGEMIGSTDHVPPTPTREWKPGSTIEYKHPDYAPISDYVGEATFVVGLYSKSSGERVPLSGDAVEPRAVKAGSFEMRERAEPFAVVFREGWHPPEAPKGSGLELRWSTKSGRLTFANPKRDVELILELDQPASVFEVAQHIEIRAGESVVDAFHGVLALHGSSSAVTCR